MNNNEIMSMLHNYVCAVHKKQINNDDIFDFFYKEYDFERDQDFLNQAIVLLNNYFYIINDTHSIISQLTENIKYIKEHKSNDKDSYTYKKQQYFIDINQKTINRLNNDLVHNFYNKYKSDLMKKNVIDKVVINCFEKEYLYLYDITFNFGVYIKFILMPMYDNKEESDRLAEMKKTNLQQYFLQIRDYVESNCVISDILKNIQKHCFFSHRLNIFKNMFDLYNAKEFQTFNNIAVLQMEGLFYDFCVAINCGQKKENEGTIQTKTRKILNDKSYYFKQYFSYFSYDVPIYRDKIVHHGYVDDIEAENCANNIILDINAIIYIFNLELRNLPILNLYSLIKDLKRENISYTESGFNLLFDRILFLMHMEKISGTAHNNYRVLKILKNLNEYKALLSTYVIKQDDSLIDVYEDADLLLKFLISEEFWNLLNDNPQHFMTVHKESLNEFLKEFIGFLPLKSIQKNICIDLLRTSTKDEQQTK